MITTVCFDWAGTIIDWGSMAPALAFQRVFAAHAIPITEAEARGPMGTSKRDHIAAVLADPGVSARFLAARGRLPDDRDVDDLYARFLPAQAEAIEAAAVLVPGVPHLADALRSRRVRIGTSTGYTAELDALNRAAAKSQGFTPDAFTAGSLVSRGRPAPDMLWRLAMELGAPAASACVAVDDTPVGIVAARNAGMWAVGVVDSGNELGLGPAAFAAATPETLEPRRARAAERLLSAGAHLVVPTVAQLPDALRAFEWRLEQGERP